MTTKTAKLRTREAIDREEAARERLVAALEQFIRPDEEDALSLDRPALLVAEGLLAMLNP
ncbi:MAG TPA: hypothetical protein VNY29_12135 [Terriglobales bacterium]|jgi:hypothetical protein|nr:hypothetical protein [Terriglobales bacterium]